MQFTLRKSRTTTRYSKIGENQFRYDTKQFIFSNEHLKPVFLLLLLYYITSIIIIIIYYYLLHPSTIRGYSNMLQNDSYAVVFNAVYTCIILVNILQQLLYHLQRKHAARYSMLMHRIRRIIYAESYILLPVTLVNFPDHMRNGSDVWACSSHDQQFNDDS